MLRSVRLQQSDRHRSAGFTLVEVLVATAVLSAGLIAVAQLASLATLSNLRSRDLSYTTILASQKLNELLSTEIASLPHSSPDAWMRSPEAEGELLDLSGTVLAGPTAVDRGVFIRRWSITAVPGDAAGGVAIQVSTGRVRRDGLSRAAADAAAWDVSRVVGIRTGVAP